MIDTWLTLAPLPTWKKIIEAVEKINPQKAKDIHQRSIESQYYIFETEV